MLGVSWKLVLLLGVVSAAWTASGVASHTGDQVWRFYPTNLSESYSVRELIQDFGFDVWSASANHIDFLVQRNIVSKLAELWRDKGIRFDVLIHDVGKLIERERGGTKVEESGSKADFTFDQYHPLSEIFTYLDSLAATSDLVTVNVIGTTSGNRDLRMVSLRAPSGTEEDKPVVWIDCGIHAREWITPATCLWGINYVITNYGLDPVVTELLDNNDIVMVPVLNADGYDYTWTDDRLWRKNRMYYASNTCTGVDLNRNYDDGHWGGIGSSNLDCSEIYHGPLPFSELETTAVQSEVLSLQASRTVKAFFSIHSYGQYWLFAYGWSNNPAPDQDEMYRVSQVGVDAIASVNGTVYTNGPHFSTIYPATGTSVDWGYSLGIVHTYIIELRDEGEYGFLLPEDQIVPTATEVWTGIVAAINAI